MTRDIERIKKSFEVVASGCWEWRGCRSGGYGKARFRGRSWLAHRAVYVIYRGEIPPGLQLDHLLNRSLA